MSSKAGVDVEVKRSLERLGRRVKATGRSYRSFNPLSAEDRELFLAVFCGEHCLNGMTNRSVCEHLAPGRPVDRRFSNRVSRLLKRLHVHGLIAKIPRSRRWRVSEMWSLTAPCFSCDFSCTMVQNSPARNRKRESPAH